LVDGKEGKLMTRFTNGIAIALFSLLIPVIGCTYAAPGIVTAGSASLAGKLENTSAMSTPRAAHTATLLADGRVLIAGGFRTGGSSLSDVEVFVPARNRFESIGAMSSPRAGHTATRLPDGRVLIAGGFDRTYLDTTEIFDPKTGAFSPGPRLTTPRSEHTATILKDGKILICGGVGTGWTFLASAEIFDQATNRFSVTGSMMTPRESHTSTLLKDGRVLITGGHKNRRSAMEIYSSTEIYDTRTGQFARSVDLSVKRHKHDAVLLHDGRVLVTGGSDERDSAGTYDSLEVIDLAAGRSQKVASMKASRYKLNGAVIVLKNGKVLIAGGSDIAEVFDPVSRTLELVEGSFGSNRHFATATLLGDGRVLIAGGYDQSIKSSNGAWVFSASESAR
jgi:hypothetical protein